MSNPRSWIIQRLKEEFEEWRAEADFMIGLIGTQGLRVVRHGRPDAVIYCAGIDQSEIFTVGDLDRAHSEFPYVQFVVVVPQRVEHAVYERAESLGICVDGFMQLTSAIRYDDDVSRHQSGEQAYFLSRLRAHKSISSVRRRGFKAYEIERPNLPALTIVTIDRYELTADDVYSVLEDYSDMDIDVVTIVNPNARGLSKESSRAGAQAGVSVLLLRDLLDFLSRQWI